MVAGGMVDVVQFHGKLPDSRRPSRDFDTGRKGPQGDRQPESRSARGLFEVDGRTPLHVRSIAYDGYDADTGRWVEARKPSSRLIEAEGGDWMRVGHLRDAAGWYQGDERHKLKSADQKDNLAPTPAMVTRFRIPRVDRPGYYEWDYEGVLALAGRNRTPPDVVVTTDCRTLDPARLPAEAFCRATSAGGIALGYGEVPSSLRPEIDPIARAWSGDRPRGWRQIDAVLTRLGSGYTLDRTAAAPPDHPAPVVWFLAESRRGPDYLFATAAALLLRSLDYPTRVCLGYYAAPDAYDPETGHTPVRATDLHVWPEVRLADGHWLVIEPTPGYEVLGPNLPLSERIRNALAAAAAWAGRHAAGFAAALVVAVVVWVRRRELIDAAAVRLWAWFPGRTWRDHVRRAVTVLGRRGRWAGMPRAHGQTFPSWLRGSLPMPADADLDHLTRMAEWAAYAPDVPPPWQEAETLAVCRRVLGGWTLRKWRDTESPNPAMGAQS